MFTSNELESYYTFYKNRVEDLATSGFKDLGEESFYKEYSSLSDNIGVLVDEAYDLRPYSKQGETLYESSRTLHDILYALHIAYANKDNSVDIKQAQIADFRKLINNRVASDKLEVFMAA